MTTQTKVASSRKGADFFKGVKAELKKVNWPNQKEMVKYTGVVVFMCFISTIFIGLVDAVFKFGIDKLLK